MAFKSTGAFAFALEVTEEDFEPLMEERCHWWLDRMDPLPVAAAAAIRVFHLFPLLLFVAT